MDCEEIKAAISGYIKRSLPAETIQAIEEHLCICESCRSYLSVFLEEDKDFSEENVGVVASAPKVKSFDYLFVGIGIIFFILLVSLFIRFQQFLLK